MSNEELTIGERTCCRCGQSQPEFNFYRTGLSKNDGFSYACRSCSRLRVSNGWKSLPKEEKLRRARRPYNVEKKRENYQQRKIDPQKRQVDLESARRRKKNHPEKFKARKLAQDAVKNGTLVRPTVCDGCNLEKDRIEGHHPDYSKPLEVIWLCVSCHRKIHYGIPLPAFTIALAKPCEGGQGE